MNFKEFAESKNKELYDRIMSKNRVAPIDPLEYPNREHEGLEGPFRMESGIVLYYDRREGKYYDPKRDFFVDEKGNLM